MSLGKYRGAREVNAHISKILFSLILSMLFIGLSCLAYAGTPVDDDVYFYNVAEMSFSLAWQVDTPSTCTVEVYTDINGNAPVSPTPGIHERTKNK